MQEIDEPVGIHSSRVRYIVRAEASSRRKAQLNGDPVYVGDPLEKTRVETLAHTNVVPYCFLWDRLHLPCYAIYRLAARSEIHSYSPISNVRQIHGRFS